MITLGVLIQVFFVFNDYAYAKQYIAEMDNIARQQNIDIPFEFGQVAESFISKGNNPHVILIQDLH